MRKMTATAITIALTAISSCTEAESKGHDMKHTDVEQVIKENLVVRLQAQRKALIELDQKERKQAFAIVKEAIYNDPRDVSFGPKEAKVTIVEFFDYNCGFCKQSTGWLKGVIDKYPDDVRIVFKELPLLDGHTKTSRNAAKAALAAARQDKYLTMHYALMAERSLTKERILSLSKKADIDIEKLTKDMEDPDLNLQLEDGLLLATRIPYIQGTPFFIINDNFVSGGNIKTLDTLLEKALKES